ncbi:MAG: N-acetylmuramoyl-L-alanine amidase [Pseudopedobacter saltans]|uniref:N-acetylmuramoyl-L-alanine amidase n=1 Tax=Pseudopedobacter saltans TaxID=151895 RepID=A0A2W5GQ94_9SPHI|nr:MAG: N-acetylmuramoyl-L-alanine amidase [Pseudopedobacter saltans]
MICNVQQSIRTMLKRTLQSMLLISTVLISCGSSNKLKNKSDNKTPLAYISDSEDKDFAPMASPYLKTIVIDPGHGGRDGGARGAYSNEKDVALKVGLKLRDILKKKLPNCRIVMTRSTDITQNVKVKADIANKAKGDLFISIHCNSTDASAKNQPSGTETYIWGIEKNGSKELAMRENASLFEDKNLKSESENFKPNDPEKKIYYSLKTRKYFQRSYVLAESIEKEFIHVGRSSRSAKQRTKGIWVLQATAMPSVLVETGFISNAKEEKYLNSASGQTELATCVAKAVVAYNKALNKTSYSEKKNDIIEYKSNNEKTKKESKSPKALMKKTR